MVAIGLPLAMFCLKVERSSRKILTKLKLKINLRGIVHNGLQECLMVVEDEGSFKVM